MVRVRLAGKIEKGSQAQKCWYQDFSNRSKVPVLSSLCSAHDHPLFVTFLWTWFAFRQLLQMFYVLVSSYEYFFWCTQKISSSLS